MTANQAKLLVMMIGFKGNQDNVKIIKFCKESNSTLGAVTNQDHQTVNVNLTTQTKVEFNVFEGEQLFWSLLFVVVSKGSFREDHLFCEAVLKKKTKSVHYMCKLSVGKLYHKIWYTLTIVSSNRYKKE